MSSEISYEGRVAVVTGAGKGMGREHALLLAGRGAAVVVDDIDAIAADHVVTMICDQGGRAVVSHQDVSSPEGGEAIVRTATDSFGTIDIVVHNAGYVDCATFEDMTPKQITDMIDTCLLGGYWVTQPAWRTMKEKGYGRVVLIGSGSAMMGHRGFANYMGAKAGLYGLLTSLAYEGAPVGIRTNLILPAAATTIMDATFAENPDFYEWSYGVPQEVNQRLHDQASRFAPTVATQMVGYLASEECSVNGECFSTTAARYARAFFGLAEGWVAADPDTVTPEAVMSHLPQIRSRESYSVPMTAQESMVEHTEMTASSPCLA